MDDEAYVSCPGCAWSGRIAMLEEAEGEYACPACGATVLAE